MAKKELAIRLLVDKKDINKLFALLGEDVLSAEELDKRFFDRDPLIYDLEELGADAFSITAALVAIIEDDNRATK